MITAPKKTSESIISKRRTRPALLPMLAVFMLIISACGEGKAPPPGERETGAAMAATDPEEVLVEIAFDEYIIYMQAVVPSGPVDVRLSNRGFEEHNLSFVVAGSDSTVWEIERRVSPGERRTVTIDLIPGMYRAICNFVDHEDRGMFVDFTVVETTSSKIGSEQ